jgi:hypothetical protein
MAIVSTIVHCNYHIYLVIKVTPQTKHGPEMAFKFNTRSISKHPSYSQWTLTPVE